MWLRDLISTLNEEAGGRKDNVQNTDIFLNPNSSEHPIKAMWIIWIKVEINKGPK